MTSYLFSQVSDNKLLNYQFDRSHLQLMKQVGNNKNNELIMMELEQHQDNVFLTPAKRRPTQDVNHNLSIFKFKQKGGQNPYIPKFRISTAKSNQILFLYVYRFQNVEEIGNLDQWSESKQKLPTLTNNKLVSEIKRKGLKDYTIIVKRTDDKKGNDNSAVNLVSLTPLRSDTLLNYFEIRINELVGEECPCFEFGITDQMIFTNIKSSISLWFKFTSSGNLQIYRNSARVDQILHFKLKTDDVVGCGFLYHRNEIIFTHNGKKILYNFKLSVSQQSHQKHRTNKKQISFIIEEHNHVYFPFVVLNSKNVSIQTVFQNSSQNFVFDYAREVKMMQRKVTEHQMEKESPLSEQNIYGLVLNYYKFHGYDKTASIFQSQMKNRNMSFYPQNEPIKNKLQYSAILDGLMRNSNQKQDSVKDKKIRKKNKRSQSQKYKRSIQQQNEDYSSDEIDRQQNYQQASHMRNIQDRHKQDGDEYYYIEQIFGVEIQKEIKNGRKNGNKGILSQQMAEEKVQNLRKRKQEANQYRYKKLIKKTQSIKRSEEEKFKTDRLQILKNIKQGKLQQAYKLFNKSYKRINKKQKHIQVFFKANIFLKLYHEEGLNKAIQYAKIQQVQFTQYENYLFPFFNIKSLNNSSESQIPLREILFLICPENKPDFSLQKQLVAFSQFINRLLCEESGYLSSSKLQLILSHYNLIQNKVNEFDIPIGGLDLESMNCL